MRDALFLYSRTVDICHTPPPPNLGAAADVPPNICLYFLHVLFSIFNTKSDAAYEYNFRADRQDHVCKHFARSHVL